ncbi:GDP-mannose 4,6-dehydratase [Glacieibacterium sp.]|uniref:GDP-mannose 4,6-dehydratase n=1 Tax=Glacieibacterium sp. TaxID=2860237 RepID=UPI003AFFB634
MRDDGRGRPAARRGRSVVLTKPRVLVTGLSGFTGIYVAEALAARGLEAVDPAAVVESFDLTLPETIADAVARIAPDYVVHLAAISFVGHDDPADFYRVNTIGTVNLLQALAGAPQPVRKIVVASSANIYGNTHVSPLDEASTPAPVNHYACSKLAMEHLVRQWFDRLPIVVTRPFNYTGRGQSAQFLVPKIVGHFARREPVLELGNLDVARDFTDVRDVASFYAELLLSAAQGEFVNICSGHAYSLEWIVETCAAITRHEIEIQVNPAFVRSDEIKTLVGDPAKLDALLGQQTRHHFGETLSWMLEV